MTQHERDFYAGVAHIVNKYSGVNEMREKEDFYETIRHCLNYNEAMDRIYEWITEDGDITAGDMSDLVLYAYKVFVY